MEKVFYHLTHPERVDAIRTEGFNDEKVSQSHTLHDEPKWYRTYLTRKRYLAKWIRILGREYKWPTFAILEVAIPQKKYDQLLVNGIEDAEKRDVSIMDWGDQLVIDSHHPVKLSTIDASLKVTTIKNPHLQGIRATARNLGRIIAEKSCTEHDLGRNPFKPWSDRNLNLNDLEGGASTLLSNGLPVTVYLAESKKIQNEVATWPKDLTHAMISAPTVVVKAEVDGETIYLVHRLEISIKMPRHKTPYGSLEQLSDLPIADLFGREVCIVYQDRVYLDQDPFAKILKASIEFRQPPKYARFFLGGRQACYKRIPERKNAGKGCSWNQIMSGKSA